MDEGIKFFPSYIYIGYENVRIEIPKLGVNMPI